MAVTRCAGCGVGPKQDANIRPCVFNIRGEFWKDYPLCQDCASKIADEVRKLVGSEYKVRLICSGKKSILV